MGRRRGTQKRQRDGKGGRGSEVWQERKSDLKGEKDSTCHRCLRHVGAHGQRGKDGPQLTAGKETGTSVLHLKGTEVSQSPE